MRFFPLVALLFTLSISVSSDAAQPSSSEVVSAQQQSVVKLFGAGVGNRDSYGSGVLISEDGHVATV